MSFAFATTRPRRKPSLTPMIDVVFLLLVFFMLAARFGQDGALTLTGAAQGAADWPGPPRLVEISPEGQSLNGAAMNMAALLQALTGLTETQTDPIILRPDDAAELQRMVIVMQALDAAGYTNLILVAP